MSQNYTCTIENLTQDEIAFIRMAIVSRQLICKDFANNRSLDPAMRKVYQQELDVGDNLHETIDNRIKFNWE